MLTNGERTSAALELRKAELDRSPIPALSDTWSDFEVLDAYDIQMINVLHRVSNGASIRGHKIGLTSKAMQEMLFVNEPDYGHLLDDMFLFESSDVVVDRFCAPKIEVEIGFVLGETLSGPGCTTASVLRATEFVLPCLEIIDSRIRNWKITLSDTIADNASSAGVVLGGVRTSLDRLDLRTIGAVLQINGETVDTGTSGAVLGNPATAVAWLANKVAEFGATLEAGHVILPGSCTRAHDVAAGSCVRAEFDELGSVEINFIAEVSR